MKKHIFRLEYDAEIKEFGVLGRFTGYTLIHDLSDKDAVDEELRRIMSAAKSARSLSITLRDYNLDCSFDSEISFGRILMDSREQTMQTVTWPEAERFNYNIIDSKENLPKNLRTVRKFMNECIERWKALYADQEEI